MESGRRVVDFRIGPFHLPEMFTGKNIIIENYDNSKNIFIRLMEYNEKHKLAIKQVFDEGAEAKSLDTPPELEAGVLCVFNGCHYRGVVMDFNEFDDTYRVYLVDIGKSYRAKLNELKKCKKTLVRIPLMVYRVALTNANDIEPNEPLKKIVNFMYHFVGNELPALCTFRGNSPFYDGVVLKTNDGIVINELFANFCVPAYDRLINGNKKLHELRVFMADEVDRVDFSRFQWEQNVVIKVVNLSEFVNQRYIACSLIDVELWDEYEALLKRINKYCEAQKESYIPREGEICLAFGKDNKYHRAIAGKRDNEKVHLLYPDTLDTGLVHHNLIKKILEEFVETPLMSIKCYIFGIDAHTDTAIVEKVAEILQNNKSLTISRIRKNANMDGFLIYFPELIGVVQSPP